LSGIPIFAGLGWLWFIAMVVGYVIFLVAFWRIMKHDYQANSASRGYKLIISNRAC